MQSTENREKDQVGNIMLHSNLLMWHFFFIPAKIQLCFIPILTLQHFLSCVFCKRLIYVDDFVIVYVCSNFKQEANRDQIFSIYFFELHSEQIR